MSESKNYKEEVFRNTLCERIKEEKIALFVLSIALVYALISNILYYCEPLPIDPRLLSIMDSIDEVIRNFCYGIGASVCFYLFHNVIRNHRKTIDAYNEMFSELHKLWWNVRLLLNYICDDKYDSTQDLESLVQLIYLHFCKDKKERVTGASVAEVSIFDFHFLFTYWVNLMTEKKKFLEVFGNVISREEFLGISNNEYDICLHRMTEIMPEVETFEKDQTVTVRDYDILRTARLILELQSDLAKMVMKYSIYDYSDTKYRKELPN